MIPYVGSGQVGDSFASITFFAKGRHHTVAAENPNFKEIVSTLTAVWPSGLTPDVDRLIALAEPVAVVIEALANSRLAAGVVEVRGGSVLFNGKPVHSHLADRILQIAAGGNVTPWVNFMTNLYQNPSFTARSELYLWLEKAQLPVTPDGHFLAYKKVREDFYDSHSGTLDYSPGAVVEMPRHEVDDDRNNLCSSGLHFCSADYLPQFGAGSSARVVLVKINPADVVSIPSDYDNTKGRAWRIEVVEDVTEAYTAIAWPPVASTSVDWGYNIDAEDDANDDYNDYGRDWGDYHADDDDDDFEGFESQEEVDAYYLNNYGLTRDQYYGAADDVVEDDPYEGVYALIDSATDAELDGVDDDTHTELEDDGYRYNEDDGVYKVYSPSGGWEDGTFEVDYPITPGYGSNPEIDTAAKLVDPLLGNLLAALLGIDASAPRDHLNVARYAYENDAPYPNGYDQDNWDVRYVDADVYEAPPWE